MSFSSLRFNYVQFLCCWKRPCRGERGFFYFFPFFSFIFCPLVCSFHQKALRHGAGAVVCSDLYLLIPSDRISLKEIPSLKMGMARDPLKFSQLPAAFLLSQSQNTEAKVDTGIKMRARFTHYSSAFSDG